LAFLGIGVLSGYGSIVYVETISVVDVKCEFVSDFKSVGINQTLHSVYVKVICEYVVEVPFNSDKNSCETMILISETVLVGKVPDIYLSNGIFK
ncbi:MAG: sporulation protein YunB, partial [Clostridia bacterium]|nr:sporulation protein YunB [Clostridia bacterium]